MKISGHTAPNEELAWSRIASSPPDQSQPLRCAESGAAASWLSILPVSTAVTSSDMCLKKSIADAAATALEHTVAEYVTKDRTSGT
jgi:hypothetical protein